MNGIKKTSMAKEHQEDSVLISAELVCDNCFIVTRFSVVRQLFVETLLFAVSHQSLKIAYKLSKPDITN